MTNPEPWRPFSSEVSGQAEDILHHKQMRNAGMFVTRTEISSGTDAPSHQPAKATEGGKAHCSWPTPGPHSAQGPGHVPVPTATRNLRPQVTPPCFLVAHSDFHKEPLPTLEQHHDVHGDKPQRRVQRKHGDSESGGISKAISPAPFPSRTSLDSLLDRTTTAHIPPGTAGVLPHHCLPRLPLKAPPHKAEASLLETDLFPPRS